MQRLERTIGRAAPDLEGVHWSPIGSHRFSRGLAMDLFAAVATRPPGGGRARPGWEPGDVTSENCA